MPECSRVRVRLHGPQMLEIKARLPMERGPRQRIDLDIELPAQLQLDERSLPRERLLAALLSHSRYQVRREGLDLLGSQDDDNPLQRLEEPPDPGPDGTVHELRMAANLLHSALKDELRDSPPDSVVARARPVLGRLDALLTPIESASDDASARAARRVREYVWTTTTRRVARVVLESAADAPGRAALTGWLAELEEQSATRGFVPLSAGTAELARDAELKKWVQSILYLPVRESRRNDRIFQVVAGVAAGAAMTIAVLATIFAESRWSGGSLPWAIALVGAYIVKDRLKEGLRTLLVHRIPGIIQDRVMLLYEPQEDAHSDGSNPSPRRSIGRKVAVVRYEGSDRHWTRLHIEKRFRFRLGRLLRHQRVDAVVEILRIDVSDWLARMDREWKLWPVRGEDGRLVLERIPRHYHLQLRVGTGDHSGCWFDLTATRERLVSVSKRDNPAGGSVAEARA